jgi:hypothetical protein
MRFAVMWVAPCTYWRGMISGADDNDGTAQIMYGVLYAISPEIFPAKDRGTGNGLTATATSLFAILVRDRVLWSLPVGPLFLFPPFSPSDRRSDTHFDAVSDHRIVHRSDDCHPGVYQWRLDHVRWSVGFGVTFRTTREGLSLDKVVFAMLLLVS